MKIDRHITWMALRKNNEAGDTIILGKKLSGFGKGKIVGIGGKVEEDEDPAHAALREVKEEIGVEVTNFKECGAVVFDNLEYKDKPECVKMHLFLADDWEGKIKSSKEIEPLELKTRELDYSKCWEDTAHWLPYILADEEIEAYFRYASSNNGEEQKIDQFWVDIVPKLLLADITDEDFGLEGAEDTKDFRIRRTARGILLDKNNRIGLVHLINSDTYTVPGGGIEKDEFIREALRREMQEETGYDIEILDEVGKVIDERKECERVSISYAYICRVGEQGERHLTEGESEEGLELEWFDDIDEAIEIMENRDIDDLSYRRKFIQTRDLNILLSASGLIRARYDRKQ